MEHQKLVRELVLSTVFPARLQAVRLRWRLLGEPWLHSWVLFQSGVLAHLCVQCAV